MAFEFRCTRCERRLRMRQRLLDKLVRCPDCSRTLILRTARARANGSVASQASAGHATTGAAVAMETAAPPAKRAARVTTENTPSPKRASSPPAKPAAAKSAPPPPKTPPRKTEIPASKPAPKPIPVSALSPKPAPAPWQEAPPTVTRSPAPLPRPAAKKGLAEKEGMSPRTKLILAVGAGVVGLVLLGWFLFGGSSLSFVSGTITLDGEPLTEARVDFVGDASVGDASAERFLAKTDDKGHYVLRSNTNAGIPPGKYKVTVSKLALKDGQMQSFVHKVYEELESTPLHAEVGAGSHTKNFELKKQP
jgi:predicted RNA-binding Zn-ribbon protein involved in translation (DUF1610 family)